MDSIKDNISRIREAIDSALLRARLSTKVKVMAVTKKVEPEKIASAFEAGLKTFGENYIQEAVPKIERLKSLSGIDWHFIGSLQSNKAKFCPENFSMVETVDRESVAVALNKEAKKKGKNPYPVLVEVNLAAQSTKTGCSPENVETLLHAISPLDGISVRGLMAIPPVYDDPQDSRKYFIALKNLAEKIKDMKIPNIRMDELSMGMSHDFHVAVEEGATIVRIGTAIFGKRG